MRKTIIITLCLLVLLTAPAGCGTTKQANGSKLQIVAAIFPEYDWVRQLLGETDSAELTLLLDSGVDLHSYQPTADDVIKISTCDMFLYVGGESDRWVKDALAKAKNKNMIVVSLLDVLGDAVKEEEVVEGMQAEEEEDEEGEEEPEYDEHVWLSLQNAALLCGVIAGKLCLLDPAHSTDYTANCAAYTEKLTKLDGEYRAAVEAAPAKVLLFGDRFPFRYLTEDYGLGYYAAFVGCSAESEASFATIAFLAGKVDELGLSAILQIESSDGRIAKTIRETTRTGDQKILTLDSMQSVTAADVEKGITYLAVMEQNLAVLKEALQ